MASVPPSTASASSQAARLIEYDKFIDRQIRRTRGTVKLVDLASRLMSAVAVLLLVLLLAAVVEHWLIPGGLGVLSRFILSGGILVAGGWYLWRQIAPLILRPISPVYAAREIESQSPGLKNTLLNLLLFRQHREQVPEEVYRTVEEQAATRLATADVDAAVDRTSLIRIGYVLLGLVILAGLYKVFSPKDPLATAGRVLMPWARIPVPTRVSIDEIRPGPVKVARGEGVEVTAAISGLREGETVTLRYSTQDGQIVDMPLPMLRREGEYRYRGQLPAEAPPGVAAGVQQPLSYFIEAGDARSRTYPIGVIDSPTITINKLEFDFPDYTELADRTQTSEGNIRAIEGTRVTVYAQTNHPIRSAGIDLGADGEIETDLIPLETDAKQAAGEMILELDAGTRVSLYDLYTLRFTDRSGQQNRQPIHYRMEVIPDLRPEVEITQPQLAEVEVRLGETVVVEVEARDPDYALSRVTLVARKNEMPESEVRVPLLESEHIGRFRRQFPWTLAAPDVAAGDVLEYWIEVEDNRNPEPNRASTQHKRLKVIEPPPVEDNSAPSDPDAGENSGSNSKTDQSQAGQEADPRQPQADGQPAGNQPREEDAANGSQGEAAEERQGGGQSEEEQPSNRGEAGSEPSEGATQHDREAGSETTPGNSSNGSSSTESQPEQGSDAGGDPPPDNGGQSGQANDASAEDRQGPPSERSPSSPVPSDGSDDSEAFKRITEHFQEKQGEAGEETPTPHQESSGQSAEGQPDGQSAEESSAGEGEQRPQNDQTGQSPATPDQQEGERPQPDHAGQRGNDTPSTGNESSADEAAAQQPSPATAGQPPTERNAAEQQTATESPDNEESGDPQADTAERQGEQTSPSEGQDAASRPQPDPKETSNQDEGSPPSLPSQSQGPSGGGNPPETNQGAPDPQQQAKPRDKGPQQGSQDGQPEAQESPQSSQSRHESDSHGNEGGDRTGGGDEGAGQKAPREGTGSDGQNQSADEGSGSSREKGEGDATAQGGADQKGDERTGVPGEEAGTGSQQRPGEGSQTGKVNPQDSDPSESRDGSPRQNEDSQEGSAGESGNPPETPSNRNPTDPANQPGGAAGDPQSGGLENRGNLEPPPQSGQSQPIGDAANLEYARTQTDLVLDQLENQLKERDVDPELLDKIGWSEDDLRKFVDRWRNLKEAARAQGPSGEAARRELDDALRSLGLNSGPVERGSGNVPTDELRDVRGAPRVRVPVELQEELQAYTRGISER